VGSRDDDRIDAGRIGRAQARAEISRILDLIEHEESKRAAPRHDEVLEILHRELLASADLENHTLMAAALREPVELGALHVIDLRAGPVQRRRKHRERPRTAVEQPRVNDVIGPSLEHGARSVQTKNPTGTGISHGGGREVGFGRASTQRA
jgi:hypothetical protein